MGWFTRSGCRVLALLLCAVVCSAGPAAADTAKDFVDLELVLAVDVSMSMDLDEQRLQRDGYVAAFRDPRLHSAIKDGPNGRIAVSYVEWSGGHMQALVVPWRIIASAQDAQKFADTLAERPISRAFFTSISGAVAASHSLFASSPARGLRRVIDVSGDGPNNSGSPVEAARDRIVAAGAVINGLAIQLADRTGPYTYFDLPDLDRYYRDCVIGGPGAFVLTIRNKREFASAIRKKLLLEVAGRTPSGMVRVWRAQAQSNPDKYDCLIGEKMWQQYQRNRGNWP
ncbi:MAG: DUF1194 domain-containing protein [Rhizobiales bacterium]|nr:DUF1194 domain-containing protein [Hyphomicrobiales bacterium]